MCIRDRVYTVKQDNHTIKKFHARWDAHEDKVFLFWIRSCFGGFDIQTAPSLQDLLSNQTKSLPFEEKRHELLEWVSEEPVASSENTEQTNLKNITEPSDLFIKILAQRKEGEEVHKSLKEVINPYESYYSLATFGLPRDKIALVRGFMEKYSHQYAYVQFFNNTQMKIMFEPVKIERGPHSWSFFRDSHVRYRVFIAREREALHFASCYYRDSLNASVMRDHLFEHIAHCQVSCSLKIELKDVREALPGNESDFYYLGVRAEFTKESEFGEMHIWYGISSFNINGNVMGWPQIIVAVITFGFIIFMGVFMYKASQAEMNPPTPLPSKTGERKALPAAKVVPKVTKRIGGKKGEKRTVNDKSRLEDEKELIVTTGIKQDQEDAAEDPKRNLLDDSRQI
eukprot:TRINITY_DN19755_c0_g1_i2.p1 TRINITY_DN19755_c0_g1~~TRINITY_DN19755_c0_g1_i2.p1  ORF type:complete len:398 (+),score=58.24 TRINITY_DN19755_c0_g1_i2:64-1257(+)